MQFSDILYYLIEKLAIHQVPTLMGGGGGGGGGAGIGGHSKYIVLRTGEWSCVLKQHCGLKNGPFNFKICHNL